MTYAIAVAQTVPVRGDVEANVRQHLRLVEIAADARPGVIVFPELSLTGYELDLARALAFAEGDARLDPLRSCAASAGARLIVGAPVRLGARLHIASFVLSPDGSIEVYTKRRLGAFSADANPGGPVPPPESTVFEPGDRDPLIELDGRPASLAICADIGNPVHAEQAAARGAGSYLASMFVIPAEYARDTARLGSYARRHGMTVGMANFGGPSGGLPSAGGSAVWSAQGDTILRLPPEGAAVGAAVPAAEGWRAHQVALPRDQPR